jgi:hypothetical protein
MSGDPVPASDHVVKYVGPSKWQGGQLDWSALLPRQRDMGRASYNWLEYYTDCTRAEQLSRIRTSCTLDLKRTGAFVMLQVGGTCERMLDEHPDSLILRFTHQPIGTNESHCEMAGAGHDDTIAGFILNRCVLQSFPGLD